MNRKTFVDTSGFYALLVKRDDRHEAAREYMDRAAENRDRFVTTDYVLDETATLLKARGHLHLLRGFFETVLSSSACRVEWTDAARFSETSRFFIKHLDQRWSFTDCLSFCVMKQSSIRAALTKDSHFEEAGFVVLL